MPATRRTPTADAAADPQPAAAVAVASPGLLVPLPSWSPPGGWTAWAFGIAVGIFAGLLLRHMELPPWAWTIRTDASHPIYVQQVGGPLPPGPLPPGPNPGPGPGPVNPFPGLAEQVTAAARSVGTAHDAGVFADALDKFTTGNRSFADVLDVFRQLKAHQTAALPVDLFERWKPFSKEMGVVLWKLNLQTPADALAAIAEVSRGLRAV